MILRWMRQFHPVFMCIPPSAWPSFGKKPKIHFGIIQTLKRPTAVTLQRYWIVSPNVVSHKHQTSRPWPPFEAMPWMRSNVLKSGSLLFASWLHIRPSKSFWRALFGETLWAKSALISKVRSQLHVRNHLWFCCQERLAWLRFLMNLFMHFLDIHILHIIYFFSILHFHFFHFLRLHFWFWQFWWCR